MAYIVTWLLEKPEGTKWFYEVQPELWKKYLESEVEISKQLGRTIAVRHIDENTAEEVETYPNKENEETFSIWRLTSLYHDMVYQFGKENHFNVTMTVREE